MNHSFKDINGQTFGRLKVISLEPKRTKEGRAQWLCLCECGNKKIYPGKWLRRGYARSCGCLQRECQKFGSITHKLSGTPEHRIWGLINTRCRCERSVTFKNYGGRGIKVCSRWRSFENFMADMGPRPSPEYCIERINNEGNYEPSNCKWATRTEQARNRRTSRFLTFRGKTKTVAAWSEATGINSRTIRARLDVQGWSIKDALTKPLQC